MRRRLAILALPFLLAAAARSAAATDEQLAALAARLDEQLARIEDLEKQVAAQNQTIEVQNRLIAEQSAVLSSHGTTAQKAQTTRGEAPSGIPPSPVLEPTLAESPDTVPDDPELAKRLAYLEQQLQAEPADPLAALADPNFPGSWRIPGSTASMSIGGYVKTNFVQSFDPLLTRDRFIVGSIPPSGTNVDGAESGSVITVEQSRVNLDLRDATQRGTLRAFVEGDFAADASTFRLRHAYGQFGQLLAGQTWSTFMDLTASPEELDFEGINGRINVRQPQLRYFPTIGRDLNLRLSVESPSPQITGGEAATAIWDVIASLDWNRGLLMNRESFNGWSARSAIIGRQIKGRADRGEGTRKVTGWGITGSGTVPITLFNDQDRLLWQLTYGEGIGRYVNDTGTVGGLDAIFAPDGDLEAFPIWAGYVSYQHWWAPRWRSNATVSWVEVDTFDFQDTREYLIPFGPAYERTLRTSVNLLFNPVPRLEAGVEFLWGERRNSNRTDGDAAQMQISARYLY